MRRIISVVLVVALLLAVTAASAFAQGQSGTAPNCEKGNDIAYGSNGQPNRSGQATDSLNKTYDGLGQNPNAAYCLQ